MQPKFQTLIYRLSIFGLILIFNSCQVTPQKSPSIQILNTTVSTTFAPDGRLWRLIPSNKAMYIQYSEDAGKSYSSAIRINKDDQKISAWPENPPAIKISDSGRIYILYYADEKQKSTSFLSYSDDNGHTFSSPQLISDHAETAMHYMDKMLLTKNNRLHIFWHDTRDQQAEHTHNSGITSLYYASPSHLTKALPAENKFISNNICSCCRTATALTPDGTPVILARMIFDNGSRDHAMIKMSDLNLPQRVTHDNWNIEACPEHGPALTIDKSGRSHFAWFTMGGNQSSLFYAHTDDYGKNVSQQIPIGNAEKLPSHPDILSVNQRVTIAWKEFDGTKTQLHLMESHDRGITWVNRSTALESRSKSGHPQLISNGNDIFLSWTTSESGHQIKKI